MEIEKNNMGNQLVSVVDRKRLELTGAIEVLSSTDKEIVVKLEGAFMYITGEKLTILKLIPTEKSLAVAGVINGINYQNKYTKKSFFKKVFK